MASPQDEEISAGSVLRDLIFNQYQAIILGGTALASLVALNPLPLLVWLGSEMVLLPILDSGPLRRLISRRKIAAARTAAAAERADVIGALTPSNAKRYAAMEQLCHQIAHNYQGLTGISQVYLSDQRSKLDVVLHGYLNRLLALQRYERMPLSRHPEEIEREIEALEEELKQEDLPARAAAALKKNIELKRKLLASVSGVDESVRTLNTELDSMESLLEVLHQNSISLRDPVAIADELDSIVRQSEDSEKVVREMEALLRSDVSGLSADLARDAAQPQSSRDSGPASDRSQVKSR